MWEAALQAVLLCEGLGLLEPELERLLCIRLYTQARRGHGEQAVARVRAHLLHLLAQRRRQLATVGARKESLGEPVARHLVKLLHTPCHQVVQLKAIPQNEPAHDVLAGVLRIAQQGLALDEVEKPGYELGDAVLVRHRQQRVRATESEGWSFQKRARFDVRPGTQAAIDLEEG
jgi:hypothetical protein